MFCGHCGKELKENDKFCPNCGQQNPLYKEKLVIGEEKKEETNEVIVKEATLTTKVEDKKVDKNEDKDSFAPLVLGILSVYFSEIPFLGLILAIIGLAIDKTKKYKVLNIVGGVLSIIMMIILIIALILAFIFVDELITYLQNNGGI